jgi:hypothetical protein
MVDTLRSGRELDFDLHIQRAGKMVHFRDRGLVFTPRTYSRPTASTPSGSKKRAAPATAATWNASSTP